MEDCDEDELDQIVYADMDVVVAARPTRRNTQAEEQQVGTWLHFQPFQPFSGEPSALVLLNALRTYLAWLNGAAPNGPKQDHRAGGV